MIVTPELTRKQFEHLCRKVYRICGINLQEGKEQLVKSRLSRRLTALDLDSFEAYFEHLESEQGAKELIWMIDAITTNKTSFFREVQHFDFLSNVVIPNLSDARLRIWCAASSTGEEPYSIAMLLREKLPNFREWDVKILATDISFTVLEKARRAQYREEDLGPVPQPWRKKYFSSVADGSWKLSDEVASIVRFGRLNLMEPFPMRGPFDIIFCRNVMIYFDKPTQGTLVRRFHEMLSPGGYLMVGHSESLSGADHDFTYVQPATYQK